MKIKTTVSHDKSTKEPATQPAPSTGSHTFNIDDILTFIRRLDERLTSLETSVNDNLFAMQRNLEVSRYEATRARVAEAVANLMKERNL